jgi:hypothetical protein
MKPAERKREAHRLREEDKLSIREIARRLNVSASTIHADLAQSPPPKGEPPPNHAGPGNQRARTHGAFSQRQLGPLRDAAADYLRETYPWLPDVRVAVCADRIALYESTSGTLGDLSTPLRVRGRDVDWQPLAVQANKAATALERMFKDLDEEARNQPKGDARNGGPLFGDVPLSLLTAGELKELEHLMLLDRGQADFDGLLVRVHARMAPDPEPGTEPNRKQLPRGTALPGGAFPEIDPG